MSDKAPRSRDGTDEEVADGIMDEQFDEPRGGIRRGRTRGYGWRASRWHLDLRDRITAALKARASASRVAALEEAATSLARAGTLVRLLTVRQVIEAGDDAINAAGLNPWAMNEGLATGDERIDPFWLRALTEKDQNDD